MRRKLLVVLVALVAGSSWLGTPSDVLGWDVEVDRPSYPNVTGAFPCYFQSVAPYDTIDCSFTITLPYGGHAVAKWQCDGYALAATVHFRNYTVHGPKSYTVPVDGAGIPTLNVGPDASMPWGDAGHARTCALSVEAVSSDGQLANVYAPQPFSLTNVKMWATLGTGEDEEPFPEPTPTPSPTPGAGTSYGEYSCTASSLSSSKYRGYVTPGPPIVSGHSYRIEITWTRAATSTNRLVRITGNTGASAPDEPTAIVWTGTDPSGGTSMDSNNGNWFREDTSTTGTFPTGSGTAGTFGPFVKTGTAGETDATTMIYCQAQVAPGDSFDIDIYDLTTGGAPGASPTPTPGPSPSPTPTPVTGGTYYPGPGGGTSGSAGFDVCDPSYTSSEKSMCEEFPDMNDVGVDECEGEDDASLAGCQPVEPWDGPTGGGGGGDDGTPGGGGTGSSGLVECPDTPIETKIGYAAPDEVPDVDDLAARVDGLDPLGGLGEAVGWIGDMVWTLPNRIGNGIKWAWNQGVNAMVPGQCLDELMDSRWALLQEEPPFNIYYEVTDAVGAATTGASSGSIPTMPLPGGGTFTFPLDDIEAGVGSYRGVMGAAVWLFGAIAALRIVAGSFGVGRGKSDE